jgi:transposase-like protein
MTSTDNRAVADNGDLRNRKDPEERGRAKRRTFEAGFKLRVLEEWDRSDAAERSAILRREGIYSSMISDWKRQRREGLLEGAGARRADGRGGPSYAEVDRLRRQNHQLQAELARAQFVIEVQGKVSALLEELSKSAATDDNET